MNSRRLIDVEIIIINCLVVGAFNLFCFLFIIHSVFKDEFLVAFVHLYQKLLASKND